MGIKLRWLLVAIMSYAVPAFAQLQTAHWYFGDHAGMDFSGATPVVLNDGLTSTVEGTAAVSDGWGELLFYTDGRTVWDKNHIPMPNGTGLAGGASAAQSALIVRQPGSHTVYYVFTAFHMGVTPGLSYSVVDMSANGGLGDVSIKDVPLQDPVSEKITAYKHSNNLDVWILSHGFGNDEFHARLLSTSGLSSPVVSSVGSVHGMIPENSIGFMKFSPDGNWLAAAIFKQYKAELFRFDRETGIVSDPLALMQDGWTYGVEFSPSSSFLYVANQVVASEVVQYDLRSGDYATIPLTKTVVGNPSVAQPGGLALAPNGKIYLANWLGYLSEITYPDLEGSACGYADNSVYLGGALAKLSIPNFPPYLFAPNWIESAGVCLGDTTYFTVYDVAEADSVRWDFGDPASGAENTQLALTGAHSYSGSGVYTATALVYAGGPADTLHFTLSIDPYPTVYLGSDTSMCPGMLSLDIYPTMTGVSYVTWHDGSTLPVYTATGPGRVWATAANACASAADTVEIAASALLLELGPDRRICRQEGILLSTGLDGMDHLWNTGQTDASIAVVTEGWYSVAVTDPLTGCSGVDSVYVTVTEIAIPLPAEAILYSGGSLLLDAGNPGSTYLWSTGETTQTITVFEAGLYTVSVTDTDGCTGSASVEVTKTSGLQSLENGSLVIGPVPTTGTLHLQWQGADLLDGWARVLAADGRLVWMGRVLLAPGAATDLSLHHLAAGAYILRLESADGRSISRTFLKTEE